MSQQPPRAQQAQRRSTARPAGQPPRAILNTLLLLAAMVLERRLRRAFRSRAGAGGRPGH